jgi:hypothetical protein
MSGATYEPRRGKNLLADVVFRYPRRDLPISWKIAPTQNVLAVRLIQTLGTGLWTLRGWGPDSDAWPTDVRTIRKDEAFVISAILDDGGARNVLQMLCG